MVKETRLYELLNVSTEATEQEIKRAYRLLALKYHPDKQNTDNNNEKQRLTEIFQSISEAYDILSNKNKRYLYDNYGEDVAKNPNDNNLNFSNNNNNNNTQFNNNPFNSNQFDINEQINSHISQANEIFNNFFSDLKTSDFMNNFNTPPFGGNSNMNLHYDYSTDNINNTNYNDNNHQVRNSRNDDFHENNYNQGNNKSHNLRKGKDIEDRINCSLLDYYYGKHIKLSLSKRIKCTKCNGTGGLKIYTCNDCCGLGYIVNEIRNGLMVQRTEMMCNRCQGTGEFIPKKYICDECDGNKLIDTKVIYDFKGPRGVSNGYRIVIPNAADEGIDLIPGDIILTLIDDKFGQNNKFKRFGNNLLTTIPIPLSQAICGGYIDYEHINGEIIKIFINRGEIKSTNHLKLLKGYGMPIHQSSSSIKSNKNDKSNKKNKKNKKGNNSKNDSNDNHFNKYDDNKTTILDITSSDTNSEDDNTNNINNNNNNTKGNKYGDLIIKFELIFPDVKSFTDKQFELMEQILASGVGDTINKNPRGGLVISSSSDDVDSSEDISLKMSNNNLDSSASSLSKAYKSSSSNFNSNSNSNSNSNTNSNNSDNGTESLLKAATHNINVNKIKNPVHSSTMKRGLSARDKGEDDEYAENHKGGDDNDESSDNSNNNNNNNNKVHKIEYLSDLSNIDKMSISLADFPILTSNEASIGNGENNISAKSTAETVKNMDDSFSTGGSIPRQSPKRAKRC